MPRRPPNKENARKRKASEDLKDPPPAKKPRYNLRDRTKKDDKTVWVPDDTIDDDDDEDTSDEEEFTPDLVIEIPAGEDGESIIRQLFSQSFGGGGGRRGGMFMEEKEKPKKNRSGSLAEIPMALSRAEKKYYSGLPTTEKEELLTSMRKVSDLDNEGDVPLRFKVLQLPVSTHMKSLVLKKMDALADMNGDSSGSYKLKTWVDGFLKIPFGKSVPLPVQMSDGVQKCTDFLVNARKDMDKHIYGMNSAKTQIMQILSQWVANPGSVGNVIALQGPMGVGKTSFAKNAIADVLKRPFVFFALGGASDIANFTGHSYTYEGSTWGRVVDSLMSCGTMNPVFYFDELDKVSATAHGEEIISMLIHMTDRAQNKEFHDRYFAGIDLDLSQCLFVFSFNDIEKVHPILKDRMNVIECGGYGEKDKAAILKSYVWPQLLERMNFKVEELSLTDQAIDYIIDEYSRSEGGVRNMIRAVETIVTRINMLRVAQHESMKEYPFYMEVALPLTITRDVVKKLMKDAAKVKQDEVWRTMYT